MLKVTFQSCTWTKKPRVEDLLQEDKMTQVHVRVQMTTCIIFTDYVVLRGWRVRETLI